MSIVIKAKEGNQIPIGYVGENLAREVHFNASMWKKDYPSGSVVARHKRNGDEEPYDCDNTIYSSDGTFVWNVTQEDVSIVGNGSLQLVMTSGSTIAKSEIYTTVTKAVLSEAEEVQS